MASMEQNLSRRRIISYSQLSKVTMFFCPTTSGGIAIARIPTKNPELRLEVVDFTAEFEVLQC